MLDPRRNKNQIFKTNKGSKDGAGGRSGSFFFFTQDRDYIIKTVAKHEYKKFFEIIKVYTKHFHEDESPNSLIGKVYGLYKLKMANVNPVYLILQGN